MPSIRMSSIASRRQPAGNLSAAQPESPNSRFIAMKSPTAAALLLTASCLLASCATPPAEFADVSDPFRQATSPTLQADGAVEHAAHVEVAKLPPDGEADQAHQ